MIEFASFQARAGTVDHLGREQIADTPTAISELWKNARSLAQLVRSGWFKAVHVKSVESQELRTLLGSREFLVNKLRDHETN